MSHIDERVVEMRFDNKQFESGVQTSLGTIDKLKEKLNFKDSVKGLDEIGNAGKKIDLSTLAAGIDSLNDKFSAMGVIGRRVLENITDMAFNAAKKVGSYVWNGIVGGGVSRAMNIEQAKFQIQGLGYQWEQLSSQIDFAVNQTAYGLDSAAKAASQLLASGVQVSDTFNAATGDIDEMGTALRAISGVAAMTNSSYDDIARIFTTVAGNGRLMGDQLNQLGARGLNAAAELGKAFGKTETEIREMVSQGEISFAMFSQAMYDAFGEHAVKANETFTGSLSNIRAALSRIGAKFVTPLVEQNGMLVEMFNAIRMRINDLNKQIGPFVDVWVEGFRNITGRVTDFFNSLNPSNASDGGTFFLKVKEIFVDLVGILKNVAFTVKSFTAPIQEAFNNIFPKKTIDDAVAFIDKIRKVTDAFTEYKNVTEVVTKSGKIKELVNPSEIRNLERFSEIFDNIRRAAQGFFSVINIVKNAISGLFRAFFDSIKGLNGFGTSITSIAARLGDFFTNMSTWIQTNDSFYNGFKKLFDFIINTASSVVSFLGKIKTEFEEFTGIKIELPTFWDLLSVIDKIKEKFQSLKDFVQPIFDWFAPEIDRIKDKITNFITGFTERNGTLQENLEKLKEGFNRIKESLKPVTDLFEKGKDKIVEFFKSFAERNDIKNCADLIDYLKEKLKPAKEWLDKAKDSLKNFFASFKKENTEGMEETTSVFEKIINALSGVAKVIGVVASFVGQAISGIINWFKELAAQNKGNSPLETIANVIGVFREGALTAILITLEVFFTRLTSILHGWAFTKMKTSVSTMKNLAVAVAILTGSLLVLSFIKTDKLVTSMMALIVMFKLLETTLKTMKDAFGYSYKGLSKSGKGIGGVIKSLTSAFSSKEFIQSTILNSIARAMIKVAGAMLVLSFALKVISSIEPERMITGLLGLAATFAILGTFMKSLGKGSEDGAKDITALSKNLIKLSVGLLLITTVVKRFGDMGTEQLIKGVAGMGAILLELGLFMTLTSRFSGSKSAGKIKAIGSSMLIISAGLIIIAKAVESLGNLDMDQLMKGLIGIGGVLLEIGAFMLIMSQLQGNLGNAAALVVAAVGITIVASALAKLSEMDMSGLGISLLALGGSLAILAASMYIMGQPGFLAGAAGMVVGALAIRMLAPAIKSLGELELAEIGKALLAIAGVFAVLGIAGAVLGPLVPAILGLSAAIALLGVGALAIGAGLVVFAAGFTALGVSIPAVVGSLVLAIEALLAGIINMTPMIIEGIGTIIQAILTTIAGNVQALCAAAVAAGTAILNALLQLVPLVIQVGITLLLALLKGISDNIEQVVVLAGDIIINLINGLIRFLPNLIQAGFNIILALINGLADAIRENSDRLFNAMGNLLSALIEMIFTAIQKILGFIPGVNDALEKAKEGVRNTLNPVEARETTEDWMTGLVEGVEKGKPKLEFAAKDAGETSLSTLDGFTKQHGGTGGKWVDSLTEGIHGGSGGVFDATSMLGESGLDGLAQFNGDFGDMGIDQATLYNSGLAGEADESEKSGLVLLNSSVDGVTDWNDFFANEGKDQANDYNTGMASKAYAAYQAGEKISNESSNGVNSNDSMWYGYGETKGANYSEGMASQALAAYQAGEKVSSNAKSGADSNLYNDMWNIGHNGILGFINGYVSEAKYAAQAARGVADNVRDVTARTLQVRSPSRVLFKIGAYGTKGLINGLVSLSDKLRNSSRDVATNGIINPLGEALNRLGNYIDGDMNLNPVITPVLDMSEIQNGAGEVEDLFSKRTAILASTNGMSSYGQLPNSDAIIGSVNQDNTQVVTELTKLRSEIGSLTSYISKLKIQLDSGALVGQLVEPMDDALGKRIAFAERGI